MTDEEDRRYLQAYDEVPRPLEAFEIEVLRQRGKLRRVEKKDNDDD